MDKKQSHSKYKKCKRYVDWAGVLGLLIILGSCIKKVDDVGGGHRAPQEIVAVCIIYLFYSLILFIGFIWLHVKLEKYFLKDEEIEAMNEAQMNFARSEMKKKLGIFYPVFSNLIKKNNKK